MIRSGTYYVILKVERGFSAHIRGAYAAPPHFNHENCWKPLEVFFDVLDKVKDERWMSVLRFRGDESEDINEDSDSLRGDQSMISAFRARMYVSSPIKP